MPSRLTTVLQRPVGDAKTSEMEAKDNGVRSSKLILAIRLFFVAFALAEAISDFTGDNPMGPLSVALLLVACCSSLLATFSPGWGALLGFFPLALTGMAMDTEFVTRTSINAYVGLPVIFFTTPTVIALGRPRVVLPTVISYFAIVSFFLATQRDLGVLDVLAETSYSFAITGVLGLVARLLLNRTRLVGKRIRDTEKEARQARLNERFALQNEVGTLLTSSLIQERASLAHTRSIEDSSAIRAALLHSSENAKSALAQLRGLVLELRDSSFDPGNTTRPRGIEDTIDQIDEELTGQGYWVSTDLTGLQVPISEVSAYLLAGLLKDACDSVAEKGTAGDYCEIALYSNEQESGIRLVSSAPLSINDLTQSTRKLEPAGGTVRVGQGELIASVPAVPTDVRPRTPKRYDWESAGRVAVAFALFALSAFTAYRTDWSFAERSLDMVDPILRVLLCLGLAIAVWRPVQGALVIAIDYALSMWMLYSHPDVPHSLISDWNYIALTALLACRSPRWSLLMIPVGVTHTFVAGKVDTDSLWYMLLTWLVAIVIGYSARYFLRIRRRQMDQLSRANAEREGARSQVRTELASELHDIVAHQLTLLSLNADVDKDESNLDSLRAAVDRSDELLESAQVDLAFLIHVLQADENEDAADGGTLTPITAGQAAEAAIRASGRKVGVSIDPAMDQLDPTAQRTIARIIREGTTNILRYAPPRCACKIEAVVDDRAAQIRVENPLPQPASTSPDSTGLGLVGLAERVRLTGGTLTSGESNGSWILEAELPVAQPVVGLSQ